MTATARRLALGVLGLAVLFGIWQATIMGGLVPATMLPLPSSLPEAWVSEVRGGYWQQAILDSLAHYTLGLLLGSLFGAASGLACAILPRLDALTAGVVRLLRPIPGLAWVPFAILWFGLNTAGATFIIAISVFWINFYAAHGAVQAIDRDLLEVAAAFGHGGVFGRLTKVVLPAAAPGILAGIRTGVGQAWMSVVAAELFGVPGIGARMTMALLYAITDTAFVLARNRLLAWQM